jgi:CRISPR-associated protein Csb2
MIIVRMRFPAGRYHATPFGHHVNEGLVEWPPSPWRLLRALIACGYGTQGWSSVPVAASSMLRKLAAVLPEYQLPRGSLAHTRHYMPKTGRDDTTLVFDAFLDIEDAELLIRWDCSLDADEQALLRKLCRDLNYLGRRESWVEAELLDDAESVTAQARGESQSWSHPIGSQQAPRPDHEHVSLLAPLAPRDFEQWLQEAREEALSALPKPEAEGKKPTKKLLKDREKAVQPLPDSFELSLEVDTNTWRDQGWNRPPGSRLVLYSRPRDALQLAPPRRARPGTRAQVEAVLLALSSPSGNRSALPAVRRSLPQAELLHRALVSKRARGSRVDCPELIGKDNEGRVLRGHRHAHILPLDLDGDGHLEHILIHAPMGLGDEAQEAIDRLERTWTKGGVGELQLARAGRGALELLRRLPAPWSQGVRALLGPEGGSTRWRSALPFVPPRHLKKKGRNSLEGQVLAELDSRQLPPAQVHVLPWSHEVGAQRHVVRVRGGRAAPPPVDVGFVLELEFEEPIHGPLCLGYAAHFGLGRFESL